MCAKAKTGHANRSIDNGANRSAVDSGISKTRITSLAVSGGTVFAGTDGNGVWRRPLSEMTGVFNRKMQRATLQQAHLKIDALNRTGSIIAIELTIPRSDQVAVKIFDLAGREISSFINQYLMVGSHRFSWDTHALARGCYAVRLQAGTSTCMILVQIVH
jgi:hypothetical protein